MTIKTLTKLVNAKYGDMASVKKGYWSQGRQIGDSYGVSINLPTGEQLYYVRIDIAAQELGIGK